MNRTLVRRLHSLEKVAGIQTRFMAFVEVYVGETLDEALVRLGIDRDIYRGFFFVEGREWPQNVPSKPEYP